MVAEYPKEGEVRERNLFQRACDKINRPVVPKDYEDPDWAIHNVLRDYVWDPGDQRPGKNTWADQLERKRKYWWEDVSDRPQINEFDTGIESASPYKRRVYDPKNWEGFGTDLSNWWRGGTRRGVDYIADLGEGIMGIGGLGIDNPFTGKRIGAGEYGDWLFEPGNIEGFGKAGMTMVEPWLPGEGIDHHKYKMDIIEDKVDKVQPMIDNWEKARNTIYEKRSQGIEPTKSDWTALSDAQKTFDKAGIQSPSAFENWNDYFGSLDNKFEEEANKDYLNEFWGKDAYFDDKTGEIKGMDFGALSRFGDDRFDYEGKIPYEKVMKSKAGKSLYEDPIVSFIPELATDVGIFSIAKKLLGAKNPILRNVFPSMTKAGWVLPTLQEAGQLTGVGGIATLYEALRDKNIHLYD